jgi:hypothetical protein
MDKQANSTSSAPTTSTRIPDGFTLIVKPDGEKYIVPEFLIPATNEAYDCYQKRMEMDLDHELSGVSTKFLVWLFGKGCIFPKPIV